MSDETNSMPPTERRGDRVLRDFFNAERPAVWRECPQPPATRQASRMRRAYRTPVAIAAAVAFFLVSYISLASFFPKPTGAALPSQGHIGLKSNGLKGATP